MIFSSEKSYAFQKVIQKSKIKTVEFSFDKFKEPDSVYWPGYFWWWNGPLEPEILIEQLRDMREHDARSVCPLAMPHEFRPTTLNNQMDVKYLSPEFFDRVKIAVEEAARLGMNYWLYDEGGWPSGEACGQVTEGHPELLSLIQNFNNEKGIWEIKNGKGVDRLNPQATQRFISLTHQQYKEAVGKYFGNTISFAFTDEPSMSKTIVGKQMPWTNNFGDVFEKQFGYRPQDNLDIFKKTREELTADDMRKRIDFFDCWSQCFTDAYFLPIRDWCRANGILAGGHLDNEDRTIGAVECGYGNILRQLRAEDVPGIDVIWRQIFAGQKNHYFPLLASSAAHQIGSPYALTESFVVYGNGLTPEQMKWITDYQYVRGITLMVAGSYPLSTKEHLMSGLRPHFGPVNPLWDFMPVYHGYTARLGYALSCGKPKIETAVYYPVRDMWATGTGENIVEEYDSLIEKLLERQCGFDFIDDDILADKGIDVKGGAYNAGSASYKNIVFYQCSWMKKESVEKLAEFVGGGGKIFCINQLPAVNGDKGELFKKLIDKKSEKNIYLCNSADELAAKIKPLIHLEPAFAGIRATARKLENGTIYFIFNEGGQAFNGDVCFDETSSVNELELIKGRILPLRASYQDNKTVCSISLPPGKSMLVLFGGAKSEKNRKWKQIENVNLAQGWQGRRVKQYEIGKHNYQIKNIQENWKPIELGKWKDIFSEDFSGTVAYKISVPVKKEWKGKSMRLSIGQAEYAAEIKVNGVDAGKIVWTPWEIEFDNKIDDSAIDLEIAVTNTLANVLTSEKVRADWENQGGYGWPGQYDARTVKFERDSRGGGLPGPVVLEIGIRQE